MKPDHPPLGLRLYSSTLLHSGHCSFRTSEFVRLRVSPPSPVAPASRSPRCCSSTARSLRACSASPYGNITVHLPEASSSTSNVQRPPHLGSSNHYTHN